LSRPVTIDLVYGEAVDVPVLSAEVTLASAKSTLFVDPVTHERGEVATGTLHIVDRDGNAVDLPFGPGVDMVYRDHRLSLRGADLSWQLIVRPAQRDVDYQQSDR